jgi:hypothetical protein
MTTPMPYSSASFMQVSIACPHHVVSLGTAMMGMHGMLVVT